MLGHNKWTSPLMRLLHYPVPRKGIKGMENMTIALSNYTGDARHYLEKLVEACGARYTRVLKIDNTHLITARPIGEKYEAARDWNVTVINHIWLEDTYVKWAIQDVSNPRFSHFPKITSLMDVVGQAHLEVKELKLFYELHDEEPHYESQVDLEEKNIKQDQPELPGSQSHQTDFLRDAIDSDDRMLTQINQNASSILNDSKMIFVKELPEGKDRESGETKENNISAGIGSANAAPETPKTSSHTDSIDRISSVASTGRKAKEKAAVKLRDDMQDLNDFQKQKRRKTMPASAEFEDSALSNAIRLKKEKIISETNVKTG